MKNKIKSFSLLTVIVTLCMHILNKIEYKLTTSKKIILSYYYHASSPCKYYEWRFGKIAYRQKGSGSPLLLVHDLTPGSSGYEFYKIMDQLSKTHEVYCLDLLGYGLSDKPNMTYTNYFFVQLIIDFIKNVIGHKSDIIAVGDSAPIAVIACHNDPEVFNRLLFINPQGLYKLNQIPSKQTKLLKLLIDIPVLGTFIYNILTYRNFIEKDFQEKYFYNPLNIHEEDILAYMESAHTPDYSSKHAFASYAGRYMNANIIHSLKEINHSIYIISGGEREENEVILENYQYYNVSIETSVIPKAKHLVHLERPEEVLKQIRIFLN